MGGLMVTASLAEDVVKPRISDAPAVYVTVPLDDYANDFRAQTFPAKKITIKNIPFDLVDRPGTNNLFLQSAEWSNWKTDPSNFYSPYDSIPKEKSPQRSIVQIPVADYTAVWLLAATDSDPALTPVVSFRIGSIRGGDRVVYHDFSATVPREAEKTGDGVKATITGEDGNLFLMRIPLGKAIAQNFKDQWLLDVDITKELRLAIRQPDPCRYVVRPLGLPSGVRIYGMTFERSPIQMEVTSNESGHVFNEPQTPTFNVTLRNPTARWVTCSVVATATDYYGNITTDTSSKVKLGPGRSSLVKVPLTLTKRGYYDLSVGLKIGNVITLRRETAFALLPPDTRKFRDESPFGTWDFPGNHYTPSDPDMTGPLYVKAGLRYGMFHFPQESLCKYGLLRGNDPKINSFAKDPVNYAVKHVREKAAEQKANPDAPPIKRWMIFHEDAISGQHVMRTPDMFTGRPPYKLNKTEQEKFSTMWQIAEKGAKTIRQEFPDAEIYFGNGNIQLLEEFLRNQFPKELLGSRGNEAMSNMRLPESQPLDMVANNASLWMERQVLDHYGYADAPLRQCCEICFINTNPGNVTMRTQASHYVRHMMHSLVWDIPLIRTAMITDAGNSYYFSNWGASGLCQAMPDIRPKPSYVAIATMTLLLDGAKFTRVIESNSPTVYAVEFQRKDQQFVTCLWTVRGKRDLTIGVPSASSVTQTDIMANTKLPSVSENKFNLQVSAEPVFLTANAPISEINPGQPVYQGRPEKDNSFVISSLGDMSEWTIEQKSSSELENYDFLCPRRKGDFIYRQVAEFEEKTKVLEIKPKLPVPGSTYLPMYSVLENNNGVEIPGKPTEIGLMVNGNGGWGRVIFELEDAGGQRWISIGAEQSGEPTRWMADWMSPEEFKKLKSSNINDWNTDDVWGRSYINFEGWRYLKFPLPGNYPGEGYHWPYNCQWRHSGNGVVKYPLTFKKLVFTLPEKVLYFTDYKPVSRQEIYVKDLMATYTPPEKAFVAE